jgi:hypothetical protein
VRQLLSIEKSLIFKADLEEANVLSSLRKSWLNVLF